MAAWLEPVERLKAPARPPWVALEVPEDPVQRARAGRRARGVRQGRGRAAAAAARRRRCWTSLTAAGRGPEPFPRLTCKHCGRKDAIDGFFGFKLGHLLQRSPPGQESDTLGP